MALSVAHKMVERGYAASFLSNDLTVHQRISVLDRFGEGKDKLLVTTNILSRGIDIGQVPNVINFDLPLTVNCEPDYTTYLHRIGRTGRFGNKGIAINLVGDSSDRSVLKQIEGQFGKPIECLDTDNAEDVEILEEDD